MTRWWRARTEDEQLIITLFSAWLIIPVSIIVLAVLS